MINILLVDDSSMDIKVIVDIIKHSFKSNVSINAFTNSGKAKSFYLTNDIDIVITDLEMPNVDGFDLIECVKCNGKQTVIAVSGSHVACNDNRTILHAADLHGADFTISKRSLYEDLTALLNKLLRTEFLAHS